MLAPIVTRMTPKERRSELNPLFQHMPVAHTLTADALHRILRDAESGNTTELFGLYEEILTGDAHIQGEFSKRKLAVIGKPISITPWDPKNADDVAAADAVQDLVEHPDWMDAMKRLLDASLFPVAVVEKFWQPSQKPGRRFDLAGLKPVNYRLVSYAIKRSLQIQDVRNGVPAGTYHDPDRWSYIVHRGHLLTSPDYWGGPMRAILFWWLFATMDRDWWARFIERFGAPFLVGKFDQADTASRSVLLSAFSSASRLFGLVISKETEVEVNQVSDTNRGEVFQNFATFAQEQISKLIIGQTMSADSKTTALGSGASGLHGEVRDDFRNWDNMVTGNTLRTQLFADYLAINGLPGRAPRAQWGGEEKDDASTTATVVKTMKDAGLQVTDEAIPVVSERLGIQFERASEPLPTQLPPAPGRHPDAALAARGGADPLDSIALAGSADLARAFRGALAPVARIVLESTSAAECEAKLAALTAGWRPGEAAELLEHGLIAFAANACVAARVA